MAAGEASSASPAGGRNHAGDGTPDDGRAGLDPVNTGVFRRAFFWFWYLSLKTSFLLFPVRRHGTANVPKTGGCLLASNHQSFLDPPLVGSCLWRQTHYMARSTLFRGVLGWIISRVNAFPVDRDHADPATFKEALRRLRGGATLVLFPEGTRTPNGLMQSLLPGIGMLAVRAGVPVVPVYVHGAFQAWPRDRRLWRFFHTIHVFFGEPMDPTKLTEGAARREGYERFAKALESRIREMEREAFRLYPLPLPQGVQPPSDER